MTFSGLDGGTSKRKDRFAVSLMVLLWPETVMLPGDLANLTEGKLKIVQLSWRTENGKICLVIEKLVLHAASESHLTTQWGVSKQCHFKASIRYITKSSSTCKGLCEGSIFDIYYAWTGEYIENENAEYYVFTGYSKSLLFFEFSTGLWKLDSYMYVKITVAVYL